jgi:hypothetical protein
VKIQLVINRLNQREHNIKLKVLNASKNPADNNEHIAVGFLQRKVYSKEKREDHERRKGKSGAEKARKEVTFCRDWTQREQPA